MKSLAPLAACLLLASCTSPEPAQIKPEDRRALAVNAFEEFRRCINRGAWRRDTLPCLDPYVAYAEALPESYARTRFREMLKDFRQTLVEFDLGRLSVDQVNMHFRDAWTQARQDIDNAKGRAGAGGSHETAPGGRQ